MLRSLAVALATLLLALPAAALAQTSATGTVDRATCAEPSGTSGSTPTVASSGDLASGGTAVSPTDSGVTSSSTGGAGATAAAPETGAVAEDCDVPVTTVAQEPEPEPAPEPEGPGEPQPDEPAGEPQPPTIEEPVAVPVAEAPATAGSLPRTGLQTLKLALLGLVLLLVGARVRVLAKRRRARARRARSSAAAYRAHPGVAPDGLPHSAPGASVIASGSFDEAAEQDEHSPVEQTPVAATHSPAPRRRGRDEWSFPDPREPAPTGLLPSTAMARRRARERDLQRS